MLNEIALAPDSLSLSRFSRAVSPRSAAYSRVPKPITGIPFRPTSLSAISASGGEQVGLCVVRRDWEGRAVTAEKRSVPWLYRAHKLLTAADEIARSEFDATQILVNSGIGVKEYYRGLGFTDKGPYLTKAL